MSLKKAIAQAEVDMIKVAELINELGYKSNDFELLLSRLILKELKAKEK
jgi:hypothetical protein